MQNQIQIVFQNMDASPAVEDAVRERAKKLERFGTKIQSCRVTIEAPHKHHKKGKTYRVVIDLRVPGREIVVSRDPGQNHAHEDVYVAIRDGFNAAARQLQDHVRVRQGKVKHHELQHHGSISSIHVDDDYGRIETPDGREVYFHRNSVLNADFEKLEVGAEVRFDEEQGDEGPQATSLHVVGKHHLVG
ncbi:MAG TPA: HPF/RaiA family ribosome-associated protein [Gammaproteobacteria bacterium]